MAKMLDNRGTTSKIFQIGRETALKSTDDSLEVVSAQFPAERKDFRANIATFEGLVLPNALLNASDNRFSKNPISNGYELVYGDKRIVITVEQATGEVVVLSDEAAGTLGKLKADTATFTNLNLPNATMDAENNTFSKDPISKGYVLSDEGKNSTLSIDQATGMVESSSGMGIKNSGYVSNCILGFKEPASVSGMTITMPTGFNINYSDGRDLYDEASNPGGIGALKSYNSITDATYTVTVSPTGEDETVSFYVLYDDTEKELFYVSKGQLYYGIKVPTVEDGYLVRRDSNGNDYYRLVDGAWVKRHIMRIASFDLVDGKTMDNFEPCYPCDLLKLTDYLVADSGGSGGGSQQAAVRSMEIPASDSETSSIALDYACYDKNAMLVLIEHTVVPPTTYELSANGKTLTFNTPIPAGMRIDLRWFSNIEVVRVDTPLASDTEFMQGTSDVLAPTVKQVHQYNGTKLPLFYPSRFPWVANNIEWLRADTFSWQSGEVYSAAYAELVSIYNAEGGANETETIGAYTITYKRCANGMKIADATQQNVIMNIYAATGSAFYFILDLGNSRFKLPRTKYSLVGYEDGLGNYVSSEAATGNGVKVAGIQSYLYFYMGTYNQSAIDNTAGLNTELFAGKADVDYVQNKFDAKANIGLDNSPYTTNRILEIPQDIKLELNNGTLTLKAGSKVYVPNGFEADGTTPKFDVVTIANDAVYNTVTTTTGRSLFFLYFDLTTIGSFSAPDDSTIGYYFSGPTAPTVTLTYALWYDTANNIVKHTFDNGATWKSGDTLPIAICSYTNGTGVTSIDQVFNGFGYIGSTVFALPGVKVQYPDELNADGSYKTGVYTTTSVLTFQNLATTGFARVMIDCDSGTLICPDEDTIGVGKRRVWNPDKNLWTLDGVKIHYFEIGKLAGNTTSPYEITSVQQYTVNSVANSNASNFSQAGRSYLSGLGMPSGRYIDLTLGASGSTYTAPANGTVLVVKRASAVGQNLGLKRVSSNVFFDFAWSSVANSNIFVNMNVRKGEVFGVNYTASGTEVQILRFYYAEGEN